MHFREEFDCAGGRGTRRHRAIRARISLLSRAAQNATLRRTRALTSLPQRLWFDRCSVIGTVRRGSKKKESVRRNKHPHLRHTYASTWVEGDGPSHREHRLNPTRLQRGAYHFGVCIGGAPPFLFNTTGCLSDYRCFSISNGRCSPETEFLDTTSDKCDNPICIKYITCRPAADRGTVAAQEWEMVALLSPGAGRRR